MHDGRPERGLPVDAQTWATGFGGGRGGRSESLCERIGMVRCHVPAFDRAPLHALARACQSLADGKKVAAGSPRSQNPALLAAGNSAAASNQVHVVPQEGQRDAKAVRR